MRLRSLGAAAGSGFQAHLVQQWSVLNSMEQRDVRSRQQTYIIVLGPFLGEKTNVVPWYLCTTVKTTQEPSGTACSRFESVLQLVTGRYSFTGVQLAGLSTVLLARLPFVNG